MLDREMAVEQNGFHFRQRRIIAIDITPARLDHGKLRVDEIGHSAAEKIDWGDKIRVEDGDEFSGRRIHSFLQRACFESRAMIAVDVGDRNAEVLETFHTVPCDNLSLVGRIIEHLNFEKFARIIELRDGLDQSLDHVALIVNRELHGHLGPHGDHRQRARGIPAVLEIVVDERIAMNAIHGKDHHHEEIRKHDGQIERIDLVKAVEGWIDQRVPIRDQGIAALQGGEGARRHQNTLDFNSSFLAIGWLSPSLYGGKRNCQRSGRIWTRTLRAHSERAKSDTPSDPARRLGIVVAEGLAHYKRSWQAEARGIGSPSSAERTPSTARLRKLNRMRLLRQRSPTQPDTPFLFPNAERRYGAAPFGEARNINRGHLSRGRAPLDTGALRALTSRRGPLNIVNRRTMPAHKNRLPSADMIVLGCAFAAALLLLSAQRQVARATISAAQGRDRSSDTTLGKGYRFERDGWIYVHVEGAPHDIGVQHGYLLAPEIADDYGAIRLEMTHSTQRNWDFFRRAAREMLWPKIDPEYQQELQGIVDGLNDHGVKLDLWDIVAMNAFSELPAYYVPWLDQKTKAATATDRRSADHCSAFVATGSWSKDRQIVMAHNNWTSYANGERWRIIFDIVPEQGYRMLMDGFPGVIASDDDFGVNANGLMITETTISDFHGWEPNGKPEFVRARKAMQYAGSIDDYVKIMLDGNNGGYANDWLLGDRKTGEIARFELGLKHTNLWRTKDGYFAGSNFPSDPDVTRDETNFDPTEPGASANARHVRWDQLMNANKGKIDTSLAQVFLADHYDSFAKKEG